VEHDALRRAVPLVLIGLLGLVVASSSSASASPQSAIVVGDSLAAGTRPYLPQLLPGWTLHQQAAKGVQTPEGVASVRRLRLRLPGHLVVSLGTNDDPRLVAQFRRSVRTVLALAGSGRCVVWPNIVRPRAHGVSYAGFNRALAAEARLDTGLRVVDWAAMTRAHPGWLRRDGVHATAAGYRARAAAIARELAACAD
jgi:lysophospholipase L1-like esterase